MSPPITSSAARPGHHQQLWGLKSRTFKPALQGGFDYAFANGFYVGNWNSSVNWLPGNSIEMDFYGGYKGEIMTGLGFDLGDGFSLSGSLTGANKKSFYGSPNKSRVIVAISKFI